MNLGSFQAFLLLAAVIDCRHAAQIHSRGQEAFYREVSGPTNNDGKAFDAREDIEVIERELSRQEPGYQKLCAFPAVIPAGSLKLFVSPQQPHRYRGQPCCSGLFSLSPLSVKPPARPFYGVERIIHYLAFDAFGPAWGQPVQERVQTLYENTDDFDPNQLNLFESTPFEISAEGTFDDIQTFGQYDEPPPDSALQVLKQEILIKGQVVATLYIVRTPQQIELIGYVEPKENRQQ